MKIFLLLKCSSRGPVFNFLKKIKNIEWIKSYDHSSNASWENTGDKFYRGDCILSWGSKSSDHNWPPYRGVKKTLLIKTNFLRKLFSFKDLSYYNFFITRFFTHMSFPQDTF